MLYTEAVDRLQALGAELHTAPGQPRRKFELAQMRTLMAALGDLQQRFRSILIAGTNGKGSTASTLASILAASGLRTGLYTSPHLVRVNERIQLLSHTLGTAHEVTDTLIPDDDFSRHLEAVIHAAERLVSEGKLPGPPSFFETVTAMAFLHFAGSQENAAPVDIAVLEVGLGGRLDATNIVEPVLSIITDISLDHTEWLGHTVTEIAREKAGILRQNGVLVTLPQHPEANQAIGEAAIALNVRGVDATAALPYNTTAVTNTRNRYPLDIGPLHIEVDSPLAGQHQQRNIALAIMAALELRNFYSYNINADAIAAGIRQTHWHARLEKLNHNGRSILLDVGHNPAGAWTLRAAIAADRQPPRNIIFGCLEDKPVEELAQILFPLFDRVLLVAVPSPRAASGQRLLAAAQSVGASATLEPNLATALTALINENAVITGSVYLVGEARALLMTQGWTSNAG
ncbi:MAG: dihydrofolate synthase / folylpolyglutamate synthase [Acidobacteriaceae bacterium]|jgi:dihydrofolate synthase/folylpolyglutamate synthase|nr:dihydrofolate synthase / folylpolyglutamate synthase [Acidobacteriaceae bacterium]